MLELSGTYDLTMNHGTGMSETFEVNVAWQPASLEPPRLKVLLIVENAAASRRTEGLLTHMSLFEPQITTAGTVAAARFALQADEFDIVLIDASMRDRDAKDINTALGAALDGCPVLSLAAPTLSAKRLQATIDQVITAFAQRCSTGQ